MSLIFVFFAMIFCHVIDDFVLQGKLADLKQRKWWEENYPNDKYKYDYVICLILHAAEWTFMILLPLAFYIKFNVTWLYVVGFIINTIIHAIVDDIKANKEWFCLESDQIIHICQIIFTFTIFLLIEVLGTN